MNYFQYLCFGWAIVGIITRFMMIGFGERWNKWEMDHAYKVEKPAWVNLMAIMGLIIVGMTWYQVFNLDIQHGWIMAVMTTLTLVKINMLLFRYEEFRRLAEEILNTPAKRMRLNISVFTLSLIFILLGIFVY